MISPRRASAAVALFVGLSACSEHPFREVSLDLALPPSTKETPPQPPAVDRFQISVAGMESPRDTYTDFARLFDVVGQRLGVHVELVQRRSYAEVNDLLASKSIDAALLCTGGYLELLRRAPDAVELIAVPSAGGSDTYQALLLVPSQRPYASLADLRGQRFAFTDALSLSGRAWIVHQLSAMGEDPTTFFGTTAFTAHHDRSIVALARGVVDGATVHSGIYAHQIAREPELDGKLRVIGRSPSLGNGPLVASTRVPAPLRARLREVLLGLGLDPASQEALRTAHIDRFFVPGPEFYDSSRRIMEAPR
ncbi:MAG: PhnD/SsuA/transferrin family substrate-binding protein [Deltaproteobacteria bacterium]|nr:PhnD/SsuA/transferrin family substrate-binding protein [Deltaproteobacteria bacterium]